MLDIWSVFTFPNTLYHIRYDNMSLLLWREQGLTLFSFFKGWRRHASFSRRLKLGNIFRLHSEGFTFPLLHILPTGLWGSYQNILKRGSEVACPVQKSRPVGNFFSGDGESSLEMPSRSLFSQALFGPDVNRVQQP